MFIHNKSGNEKLKMVRIEDNVVWGIVICVSPSQSYPDCGLWWCDSDRYQVLGHDLVSSLVFIIINISASQDIALHSQLTINIK